MRTRHTLPLSFALALAAFCLPTPANAQFPPDGFPQSLSRGGATSRPATTRPATSGLPTTRRGLVFDPSIILGGSTIPLPTRQLKGHTDGITALAFSPDGKLLASGGGDQQLILWDVAQQKPRNTVQAHTGTIHCLDFSADGKRLLSVADDQLLVVWNVEKAEVESAYPTRPGTKWARFLPDGIHFVSRGRTELTTWTIGNPKPTLSFDAPTTILASDVDAKGFLLTGDYDGQLIVWDTTTGKPVKRHERKTRESRTPDEPDKDNVVTAIKVLPDGRVTVGDQTGTWTWDRTSDQFTLIGWGAPIGAGYQMQGVFPDGKYYFGLGTAPAPTIWVREFSRLGMFVTEPGGDAPHAIAASKDGTLAWAGGGEWSGAYRNEWKRGRAAVIYLKNEAQLAEDLAADRKRKESRPTARGTQPATPVKPDDTQVLPTDPKPRPWQ